LDMVSEWIDSLEAGTVSISDVKSAFADFRAFILSKAE
jgi:hypothetical protein